MDVAVCVPTADRPHKLQQLVGSCVKTGINHLVIADNSTSPKDNELANQIARSAEFSFEYIQLDPSAGLGEARDHAWRAADNHDIIVMLDDDHRLTSDLWLLVEQLDSIPDLGGVAPDIIEPDNTLRWQSAKDITKTKTSYVRTASVNKDPHDVARHPVLYFDFIPYPAVFKTICLNDYAWDPYYPLGRCHADFYVGHFELTEWRFAISPRAVMEHYPGDDSISATRSERQDQMQEAKSRFRSKWSRPIVMGETAYWKHEHYDPIKQ